jgi:cyclophilin family peptidyl-prolyl cis-trans isomerase
MNHPRLIHGLLVLSLAAGCSRAEKGASEQQAEMPVATPVDVGSALHNDAEPTVVLNTSQGPIKLRLNSAKAPLTVDNFLSQIENGFYHQTIFHEVTPGFAVLGGGFRPDLTEKRGRYSLRNESNNGLSNRRGTIAMARPGDGMDSDTGQFFINVADNPSLDYQADTVEQCGYCVFGEVVEGMDVVDRIAKLPTHSEGDFAKLPVETVMIESATKAR